MENCRKPRLIIAERVSHLLGNQICQTSTALGHVTTLCAMPQDGGQPRFTVTELAPQLKLLLAGLFGALSKPESDQNEYIMKTVMRVIVFVGKDVRY